jgi:hypothetical protein
MEYNANQNVITATNGEQATIAYKNTTIPVLTNTPSSRSNTSYLYPEDKKVKLPPLQDNKNWSEHVGVSYIKYGSFTDV